MASNVLTVKQGDNYPPVEATLRTETGPINLEPAKEVEFRMKKKAGAGAPITGICSIASPRTSGVVVYNWASGQTSNVGEYIVEFKIKYNTPVGGIETVPNENYDEIHIVEDI